MNNMQNMKISHADSKNYQLIINNIKQRTEALTPTECKYLSICMGKIGLGSFVYENWEGL